MRRRSVAQLVEHRSPKPGVGGSSPSTPARPSLDSDKQKAGMMRRIVEFGRSVEREVKKIVWPPRKEIGVTTVMIFVMASVAAVFFFFVDWGISQLIRFIFGLHG